MSTPVEAYVGDVGTEVILDTNESLLTAVDQAIKVRKPSGVEETWEGSVVEDTKVSHTTGTGDFDEAGIYKLLAYVEFPSWSGHGKMVAIRVSSLYEG
jgi:hypothetical protein